MHCLAMDFEAAAHMKSFYEALFLHHWDWGQQPLICYFIYAAFILRSLAARLARLGPLQREI